MSSIEYYPGYSQVQVTLNLVCQTITAVTQAFPAVVSTLLAHGYPPGTIVTFLIPPQFGMTQLNNVAAQVLSVTSDTLSVNLDSTHFTAFAYPLSLPKAYTPPSVIPVSSGPYLPPLPLPYGNQDSFEGVIFNNGQPTNPIDGL